MSVVTQSSVYAGHDWRAKPGWWYASVEGVDEPHAAVEAAVNWLAEQSGTSSLPISVGDVTRDPDSGAWDVALYVGRQRADDMPLKAYRAAGKMRARSPGDIVRSLRLAEDEDRAERLEEELHYHALSDFWRLAVELGVASQDEADAARGTHTAMSWYWAE